MERAREFQSKLMRVRQFMESAGLDVVFLTTRANFSWLTAGSVNHINTAVAEGVTTLAVTVDKLYLLANTIEAPRMLAEEIDPATAELLTFPWHDDAARRQAVMQLADGRSAASDSDLYGLPRLGPDFAALRYSLEADEIRRYLKLGHEVSELMEAVGKAIRPVQSERDVEAMMADRALRAGIRPFVRLVASDERIIRFRHPISTDKKIDQRVMYIICAERGGLIVATTRLVNFAPLSEEIARKHRAVCNVDAAMILSTLPGAAIGDALRAGIETYAGEGFGDEWQLHHQGGPTGYLGREFLATPGETRQVQLNQPFAWNPSITGTKSEDTVLATPEGPVLVTRPLDWPTIECQFQGRKIHRADILVRS
jgi:Xaa-Pro aminopeptidase